MKMKERKKTLCSCGFWPAVLFVLCSMVICAMCFPVVYATSVEKEKSAPKRWRYELMRPADLVEAIETRPIAWLVVSPLEWHGEALSVGCDPLIGQAVVDSAWERVGGVRIPTMYLGVEIDYKSWEGDERVSRWGMEYGTGQRNPGSIYVRPVTMELVLRDYLYFLEREGFKLVVLVSGHGTGEHLDIMRETCEKYSKGSMKAVMWSAWGLVPRSAELRFEGAGQHGDFDEASVLGGVDPNLVDKSKFGVIERDRKVRLLKENADKIDFEKGRKIIELTAEQLEKEVNAILKKLNL